MHHGPIASHIGLSGCQRCWQALLQVLVICAPIFIIVGLGRWLAVRGLLQGDAKQFATWLVWNWCLPALILRAVLKQPLEELLDWPVIGCTVLGTLLLGGLGALLSQGAARKALRAAKAAIEPNKQSSGTLALAGAGLAPALAVAPFWANLTYLGFPLAESAYGDEGIRVAAIVNAFTMPLFVVFGSSCWCGVAAVRKKMRQPSVPR